MSVRNIECQRYSFLTFKKLQLTVPELPRGWFKVFGVEDVAVIIAILRITGPTGLVLWALLTGNVEPVVTGARLAGFYLDRGHYDYSQGKKKEKWLSSPPCIQPT